MQNNGQLDGFPVVYCPLCSIRAQQTGPRQMTCPSGHVISLHSISYPTSREDVMQCDAMWRHGSWRDRPPLL